MIPPLLSGAIICPLRVVYIALFAAMVATVSPFTEGSSEVINEPLSAKSFEEVRLGRNASVDRHSLVTRIEAMGDPDQHGRSHCDMDIARQPDRARALVPAPVPTPDDTPAPNPTGVRRGHCEAPS